MQDLATTPVATPSIDPPEMDLLSDFLANIVKQLPNHGDLTILDGAANAQASFFFRDPDSEEVNSTFYNAVLAPRVKGTGETNGVARAGLQSSGFIEAYNSLYLELSYQLSATDEGKLQEMKAKVSGAIKALEPEWNDWVEIHGAAATPPVQPIDRLDPKKALILITGSMNENWLSEEFKQKIIDDPDYPYSHMNDFYDIYKLPLSMPKTMKDAIKTVFNKQGLAGGIVAKESRAMQTIQAVNSNLANPTPENGGITITNSEKLIPGMLFEPADPLAILAQLQKDPISSLSYTATASRSEGDSLLVKASTGASVSIPILSFFSINAGGSAEGSIYKENFAGADYSIEVVINNPTNNPMLVGRPKLYNQATGQGWLHTDPIQQARKNGTGTDVSGYRFGAGLPPYEFGKGGDLGYVESVMFSQFMELKMTFRKCDSKKVREYFEQRASASVTFLGIPLGGASESSAHTYEYDESSASEIVVTMKPTPPGFIPGEAGDITQSLCNLVAVGVAYPFA